VIERVIELGFGVMLLLMLILMSLLLGAVVVDMWHSVLQGAPLI